MAIAQREKDALDRSFVRLFPNDAQITSEWIEENRDNPEVEERIEAFAARFARFQDSLGRHVLPKLLTALGEEIGTVIDNVNQAHRLHWTDDPESLLESRELRNNLIHEYVVDLAKLAKALNDAASYVPALRTAYDRMHSEAERHGIHPAEQ
jgi:hypothetical protein